MKCLLVFVSLTLGICRSALGQVNLPQGFEIVEFAETDHMTKPPRMNNCGEIVYVQDRFENSRVYLYDNGKITRLTDFNNGLGVSSASINDVGTITWYQARRRTPGSAEIVMFDNGEQTMVGRGSSPSINNLGHMAWKLFRQYTCHAERDIVFHDGESSRAITDDRFNNQWAQINDLDQITWSQGDFCVNPWVGDIPLYSEGNTIVLPSELTQIQGPTINSLGQVAWSGVGGIEVWEDGETSILVDEGDNPRLNNLGDIYFIHFDGPSGTLWDGYLYRVSDGEPTFHRLTEDKTWNIDGDINDWVEVAWRWRVSPQDQHGGIRFMRRIRTGDSEFDGDIDLIDYSAFARCMTGPGRIDRLCDCRFLDIDHDGDVDLGDFARFQNGFGRE